MANNGERDLRIVLLGKAGSGKSATGNTILGRDTFEVSDSLKSKSKLCEKKKAAVGGRIVSVVDTPGLFNTAVSKQQLKAELQQCVHLCAPGPHVFLLVLKLGVSFTQEERETVKWIQENFGEEALCRMMVVFTHADQLKGKPVEEYIRKSRDLQKVIELCDGRYHSFNNQKKTNQSQVTELLKKIDAVLEEKERRHYTSNMFHAAQTNIKQKQEKKKIYAYLFAFLLNFISLKIIQQEQERHSLQDKEIVLPQQCEIEHLHSCRHAMDEVEAIEEEVGGKDEIKTGTVSQLLEEMMSQMKEKNMLDSGGDDVTDSGGDDVTDEGNDDVTDEGEDDVTDEGEDDVTDEGEDDVTDEGGDVTE